MHAITHALEITGAMTWAIAWAARARSRGGCCPVTGSGSGYLILNDVKWLRTSGGGVVTADGEPVLLRGVGIGGWLNMENFITGFPATESSHRQALGRALGERRAALLLDS